MTATLNANGDICAVQKAGGEGVIQSVIMQCLRIASVKTAGVTKKIEDAVKSYNTERALRKIKRHPPSAVVDVIKAGEKGADNLLKENMEKPKLKIEGTSVSQSNDMDIETQSSKQSERKTRTDKYTSFIGAPSSWDPYSKGVDADKLKTSLASRVLSSFSCDLSSYRDPSFEAGRPAESAVELGRMIDRGLRNLVDAANIAALLTFRRPECTLGGDDDQEVIICAPEAREALPLAVHHLPMSITFAFIGDENTVVVSLPMTATLNANGDIYGVSIMDWKCTMMSIIFFNVILKGTSDLRKWKNPDHDYIEALVSITMHKRFVQLECAQEKFVLQYIRPSYCVTWIEHYVSDEEKVQCPSEEFYVFAVAATPPRKMDTVPLVEPQVAIMDPPLPSMTATRSSEETTGAGQQMNKKKTLKDAVKPKHKRKKMSANTDAS
ncbi:exosome complex component RRP45A isoform X1 [Olea europaea subsp. europaea]|uniref:Exosome complex component RRP45A isoform X1 n=1 Tax=Olea europaea subsp. europaea TaxID=158383 RepID=A0A8S0UJ71_OLEEU|nr:exosome complex component RRP45A isoform X1 [Olea europaea subsp. europaea]